MYEVFEQLLQKHGLTTYKVSKETGVTQSTLSNWKCGRSVPTIKTLKKIADYFGVSVDYLMNGEEKKETISLTAKEELDVIKDVNEIMKKIEKDESVIMKYNNAELTETDKKFLKESLLSMCRNIVFMNKKERLDNEH